VGCTVLSFAYLRLSRAGRVRPPLAVFPPAPSWGPDEGGIGRHPNPQSDLRLSGREICLSRPLAAGRVAARRPLGHQAAALLE
jgi:hypothetical protein